LDIMYDLPSMSNVSKVVLDVAGGSGEIKPIVVYTDVSRAA